MSEIEVTSGCNVQVGSYKLHFELPFTPRYDEQGKVTHLEVYATRIEGDVSYFLSLQKEDPFKDLVRADVQELNWHLTLVPLAMPVLRLSRKTIQSVIEKMIELSQSK